MSDKDILQDKIILKEWMVKCEYQEIRIRDLEGALAQMIGTHGEKCSDPDWNCDAVRFCKRVLKGDRQ